MISKNARIFFPLFISSFLLSKLVVTGLKAPKLRYLFQRLHIVAVVTYILSVPHNQDLQN